MVIFPGAVFEQALKFLHEFIDILKLSIDRGETDIGDIVKIFQGRHDVFADKGDGHLFFAVLTQYLFEFID